MRISDQAYNRHKVLKAIRSRAPISRTELTEATGLSGATITDVTADLLQRGLLLEHRPENAAARGRPRTQLSINPKGGIAIGAVVRTTHTMSISFVDLAGNLLHSSERPIGNPQSLHAFASRIAEIVEDAIASSPFEHGCISRLAIGLPGLVDSVAGVVHWMVSFEEKPFAFAELVAARLKIPTTIENNSTCLARGEHWFGKAQSLDNFSLIHVGLWIDSAQYVDGFPRVGGNGFNSEMGHLKTEHGRLARRCPCGGRGCLGVYGSIFGIVLGSGRLAGYNPLSPFDFVPHYHQILDQAVSGDATAVALFETAGEHLGIAVADHINMFDPANILVLMTDFQFMELVRPSFDQAVARNVFRPLADRTRIEVSAVSDDWRSKGVAAHAIEQIYLDLPGTGER